MRAVRHLGLLPGAGTVSVPGVRLVGSLAVLVLVAGLSSAEAADPWRDVRDDDGIRVSQRLEPGRALAEFRAVAEIAASRWEVLAVITDVANQPKWMRRVSEVRVLETEEPLRAVFYLRMDMPWPVSDRDAVLDSHTEFPDEARSVTHFAQTSRPAYEPVEGVIRMPRLRGHYALTALEPGRTRVEYQVDADPGGNLPDWLATRMGRDDPWHTLNDLRKRVAATRGEYSAFLRRWDPKGVAER